MTDHPEVFTWAASVPDWAVITLLILAIAVCVGTIAAILCAPPRPPGDSELDRRDRRRGPGFATWDGLAQPVDVETLTAEQLRAAGRDAHGRTGR